MQRILTGNCCYQTLQLKIQEPVLQESESDKASNKQEADCPTLKGTSRRKKLELQLLKSRLLQVSKEHMDYEYDQHGRPNESNMDANEKRCLKGPWNFTTDKPV